MEWKYVFLLIIGLFGLFMMASFLLGPVKWLFRFAVYAVVGTVLLLITNLVLEQLGMRIAINPATILAAGIFQIPGAILLVFLSYFFT